MEAYAVAVELSATHLRFMWSSGNYYSRPTRRRPGPLYTAALEYALEAVGSPGAGLDTFLSGGDTTDYVLMTTLAFAAMQVPVQQGLDGEVFIGGPWRPSRSRTASRPSSKASERAGSRSGRPRPGGRARRTTGRCGSG